jgi:predicted XRE-type DNA-binding protein
MRSKEYNTKVLDTPIRLEFPTPDKKKYHINISKVNVVFIESEDWNPEDPSVLPRNDPKIREWTEMIIERIPWDFNTSTFKDYRFDTDEILNKCINFDFDVSNIKDIIPNIKERNEIQNILASHYKLLTEAFKQLSATSGIELFNISKTTLNDFLKKCNLFSNDITINDISILWNLSNAPQSKGEIYNSGNGLCRYEFAEFIIRLAIEKFFKAGKAKTIKEAFEVLMIDYIIPGMKLFDQSSWKTEFYLVEDVDHVLKAFKTILEPIFVKYAAKGKGPTDKINLHEFRLFCNDCGFVSENFSMREIDMCFRQAMMTEIDEILDNEHLEMVYVEFVEGLARIADLMFMNPKDPQPLFSKVLEIMTLVARACPEHIMKTFEWPTDDTFFNMKHKKVYVTKYEYIPPISPK